MRNLFTLVTLASAIFASNASAWSMRINSTGSFVANEFTSNQDEFGSFSGKPSPLYGPGVFISPTDPAHSWVQYQVNVNLTAKTRDLIVFRNPQNAQIASLIDQFQKAITAGKTLVLIRNAYRSSYSITNLWEGFTKQNSFDILPGDQVTFYFH